MLLVASALSLPILASAAGNPVKVGDVLGRDLSVFGFGSLGHVGVLAGSNNVVQVMKATPYVNVVQYVSVAGFKVDTYWGSRARSVFTASTTTLTTLANQQRPHVQYDLYSSTPNPAVYSCLTLNSSGGCASYGWKKGSFRCDAFVKWLYSKTGNGSLGGSTPKGTYNSTLLTITR